LLVYEIMLNPHPPTPSIQIKEHQPTETAKFMWAENSHK
jgi:hypothetical protein